MSAGLFKGALSNAALLLGYQREFDFPGESGWALRHAEGGPNIVLWRDPELACASAGFPWFSIGLPSAQAVAELAAELDRRGIAHGGVQPAFVEVKLPFVHDSDGHLIGFYVVDSRRQPLRRQDIPMS